MSEENKDIKKVHTVNEPVGCSRQRRGLLLVNDCQVYSDTSET
jgi:hypothetical protein